MSEARLTVDGTPIKVGDAVWRVIGSAVRGCRIREHYLRSWWPMISKQIYSTERAALADAVIAEHEALRKAKQEITRATKAIKRLEDRLSAARHEEP